MIMTDALSFQFVDNSTPDVSGQSRKLIRSHVMKGRNLGRPRPTRRQQEQKQQKQQKQKQQHPPQRQDCISAESPASGASMPHAAVTRASSSLSSVFAGAETALSNFPVQLTPYMRKMMYQFHTSVGESLYPHEFCRPARDASLPWFHYMLTDPTCECFWLGRPGPYTCVLCPAAFDG
ncbi:hypothetical protein VTK73DRAFT_6500 [Phialemonium thermophilum]|uniref:Uncharacterized protein n=1 Tax=Phialemonium thermophilum TaxID=223376 RepID=A0ABR3V164_9PEZI